MRQIRIHKPRPRREEQPVDLRTPSGRLLRF
jgi:hypothetical protein